MVVREARGNPAPFVARGSTTTDEAGRYELAVDHGREHLLVASAALEGRTHTVATESTQRLASTIAARISPRSCWSPTAAFTVPGQIVFYKGIACAVDAERRDPKALAKAAITVTLRDANGREVATAQHTTNAIGSFHGSFPIPTGALPGQWTIHAVAAGHAGGVARAGRGIQAAEVPRGARSLRARP